MECKKCKSKWESQLGASKSITNCPFCGASLTDKENMNKEGPFDTSKEALIYIAKKHGMETLLGNLKNIFPDYAPLVSKPIKGLVLAVNQHGSAKILQDCISSNRADKEIAFKKAVEKLTEAFITEQAATTIILEFTEALGWNITPPAANVHVHESKKVEALEQQPKPQFPTPKPQSESVSLRCVRQTLLNQLVVFSTSSFVIGNEILSGRRSGLKFGTLSGKPILWRVLDVQDNRALLLSEDVTHVDMQFDNNWYSVTWKWESCKLRRWLNKDFLKAFSSQEQAKILFTTNTNESYTRRGDKVVEKQTQDRVFLLSFSEVEKYFGINGRMGNDDRSKAARVAKYNSSMAWWWLRSPGYLVWMDGAVFKRGTDANSGLNFGGVRPALWLKLKL